VVKETVRICIAIALYLKEGVTCMPKQSA